MQKINRGIRAFVVSAIAASFGLVACGGEGDSSPTTGDASTTNPAPKTGTFSVDGQPARSCKVETQLFPATKEFSVVCQDDAYGLVQVTFKDEASARLEQSLTVIKGSISSHPDPKTIVVGMQPLPGGPGGPVTDSTDGAPGKASSAGSTVKLEGVVLSDVGGTVKRTVSATLPY
jgi:hypothetical protein